MSKKSDSIRLRGVRQNNLKGFDLDLPLGRLIVVTGPSGAGKSSLVFETLHAEGQRRYVETFSPYTRQFLELLDRPKIDRIENIRPSIAIQQSNTVRTSRSTVGTLTELCDYFKVWFAHHATLYDPQNGEPINDDSPQSAWEKLLQTYPGKTSLITFPIKKPAKLRWVEILDSLRAQGFVRIALKKNIKRLEEIDASKLKEDSVLLVIQDRIALQKENRSRTIEALENAFTLGKGRIEILDTKGQPLLAFTRGLRSSVDGKSYRPATPALFSFNSPIGACPQCRGFGRIIEIDPRLVIPDHFLSIEEGAIRAFQGQVYSECLRELRRAAKKHGIRMHIPWAELSPRETAFVLHGEDDYEEGNHQWYGVNRFFSWLESKVYKMHVRVFLSKFRSYTQCPACDGDRLQPEARLWKWKQHTLPELYRKSVSQLLEILPEGSDNALSGIHTRLQFLHQVGLGYLTLDRTSRTLSGGETMRVNLTSCLGSSLVDTLFVLDEPSVGLHPRDLDRLIRILRRLADQGNTVVVVEHDEAVMAAADHLVEIGPRPGTQGGQLCFSGSFPELRQTDTLTGRFLSGREEIEIPKKRRPTRKAPRLSIYGASKHNIQDLDLHIPQQRFVCLSGVSGSGKSTLLDHVLYQNLLSRKGQPADDPAEIRDIESELPLSEVVRIDQSPAGKTPRSNPALFSGAWDPIRKQFARLENARAAGLEAGHFSFNGGNGRCPDCSGLGHERVEMQFVSDVYVPCQTCEGRRFKDEVLQVEYNGRTVADILEIDIDEALLFFADRKEILRCLQPLADVGLGYLKLGQPLNTLSGGESQRLKLVRYLGKVTDRAAHALILIDEPTTGLHRSDIKRLIGVLHSLVDAGHSLIVIEHNLDILKVADWIIEIGPEAGAGGGQLVAQGTPEIIARSKSRTAPFLREVLHKNTDLAVAEDSALYQASNPASPINNELTIRGAREHNLQNIDLTIQRDALTVLTGVSGSGKSSLAFDILFAEGQRRFMESMSAYARQFVEQMPRAEVDDLQGIAPTVAIEQRVTKGTRKSTVATITEVAQYLRLLYARIGLPHSPVTGEPLISQSETALFKRLRNLLAENPSRTLKLCAPVIRGRKGHHQPLADWARERGYGALRIDGTLVAIENFTRLDRYREHDIDLVISNVSGKTTPKQLRTRLQTALKLGKGSTFLLALPNKIVARLSTTRTDPATGQAYPELDPKHFSWNSPRGWCPTCRGYGQLFDWMAEEEESAVDHLDDFTDGDTCPDCLGARLNPISRAVKLPGKRSPAISLPELLHCTPSQLLDCLSQIKTEARTRPILEELLPEIESRMRFMDRVGLGYLGLDRATATLSGGEAQRIRLAAQLGTNLSGVLYVLDEPSIGLHARDNAKLIQSLLQLRDRGNTLVVVEHDLDTMRHADQIVDLGPGAGIHGGHIVACGTLARLRKNKDSLTGRYLRKKMAHPLLGEYRPLPPAWQARRKSTHDQWIVLRGARLRNLRNFDLHLPLRRLNLVCGVSGSGKSTLIRDLLRPLVETAIQAKSAKLLSKDLIAHQHLTTAFDSLHGGHSVRKVIEVDQSPIGKTPRSTPATYIGAFDRIREIYATLPEARFRGYTAGTFSFNTKGGRCETCKGAGRIKLEMNFMPDTHVTCEDCRGRRYGEELDGLQWNGKSIADVLAMSFEEAAEFFSFHTRLAALMQLMVDTGLGYINLGQYSPTLSGGEAQRLKLVSELAKGLPSLKERQYNLGTGNLYLLEEPSIGLHSSDVERLNHLLHRLVEQGHTVVLIEHHIDCIAEADHVVEIGPEGGADGGQLLYQGDLAGLKKVEHSPTADFLP
ncbi:MAG: excinuclease ABC subunit A [Coraliomargarita sp. TMED73]|nr:MAG: excinuclease ABC subunit A [Coraliomargarita sp. TMED73]